MLADVINSVCIYIYIYIYIYLCASKDHIKLRDGFICAKLNNVYAGQLWLHSKLNNY